MSTCNELDAESGGKCSAQALHWYHVFGEIASCGLLSVMKIPCGG